MSLYNRHVNDIVVICVGIVKGCGYSREKDLMGFNLDTADSEESMEARTFRI